jgi:hypothetical protein
MGLLMAMIDDRLFAPFSIEMDEHPKIAPLSDAAFRALFESTFYSRRMLSDGFLDERIVRKRWGESVAEELTQNDPNRPSWVQVEGGWLIHDFEKHHPLRADIEAKRAGISATRSQAGSKGAAKRWQADSKAMANDSSETETETETTTPKGVVPRKRGTRITEAFEVTPEMVSWAAKEASLVDGKRATEKFINHFMAKSGRDATKVDWVRTWKNWLMTDQERAERSPVKKSKDDQIVDVLEQGKRMDAEEERKAIGQ